MNSTPSPNRSNCRHAHGQFATPATIEVYIPMPVDALPGIIGQFATEEAAAIGCDPTCVVVPLLACLATAIGNKRVVRLRSGRVEPATIWGGVIDDGGTQSRIGFEAGTAILQTYAAGSLRPLCRGDAGIRIRNGLAHPLPSPMAGFPAEI